MLLATVNVDLVRKWYARVYDWLKASMKAPG